MTKKHKWIISILIIALMITIAIAAIVLKDKLVYQSKSVGRLSDNFYQISQQRLSSAQDDDVPNGTIIDRDNGYPAIILTDNGFNNLPDESVILNRQNGTISVNLANKTDKIAQNVMVRIYGMNDSASQPQEKGTLLAQQSLGNIAAGTNRTQIYNVTIEQEYIVIYISGSNINNVSSTHHFNIVKTSSSGNVVLKNISNNLKENPQGVVYEGDTLHQEIAIYSPKAIGDYLYSGPWSVQVGDINNYQLIVRVSVPSGFQVSNLKYTDKNGNNTKYTVNHNGRKYHYAYYK